LKIDKKTIVWVAELARLELSVEEEKMMENQLAKILEYMDILGELDLEEVKPTAHTLGVSNVTREDAIGESFDRETVEKMAPAWDRDHFVVPRIV
jgi:aspartyl-tRNA(Asn)/glutamyl-tRNA(Gln) amidotransferase subunit C